MSPWDLLISTDLEHQIIMHKNTNNTSFARTTPFRLTELDPFKFMRYNHYKKRLEIPTNDETKHNWWTKPPEGPCHQTKETEVATQQNHEHITAGKPTTQTQRHCNSSKTMIYSITEEDESNQNESTTTTYPQTYSKNISTPDLINHTITQLRNDNQRKQRNTEKDRSWEALWNLCLRQTTAKRTGIKGYADGWPTVLPPSPPPPSISWKAKVWIGEKAVCWLYLKKIWSIKILIYAYK